MPMLSAELWQEVRRKGQLPRWVTDFFKPGEKVNLKRGVTVSKSAQEEEEDNEEEMVDMEKEQEAMEKGKGKEYEASRFVYMGKEKRWKVTINHYYTPNINVKYLDHHYTPNINIIIFSVHG